MKFLTALVALQTILIAGLFWKVMTPEQALVQSKPQSQPSLSSPTPGEAVQAAQPQGKSPNEQAIRRIIREELAAHLELLESIQGDNRPTPKEDPVSPAEYQQRLDLANQQLEYYIQQGVISNAEMANLQMNIARLDPESRKNLLNLLSQAINSGDLDGHF